MKNTLLILITFIFIYLSLNILNVSAHPWRTASDWCHYCRTNCDSWWVAWNQRHCHGWWSSSYTPTYTVKKTCSDTYWYWSMENYSGKCICKTWYVWWKSSLWEDKCIYANTYCTDKYWWNSSYDTLNNKCECSSWYYFKDAIWWIKCESFDSYCSETYWYWTKYNSLSDKCECKYWYWWWNDSSWKNKCLSNYELEKKKVIITKTPTELCKEYYWENIYSDWTKWDNWWYNCYCESWYNFENNKCTIVKEVINIKTDNKKIDVDKNDMIKLEKNSKLDKKVQLIFVKIKKNYDSYSNYKKETKYNLLTWKLKSVLDSNKLKWDNLYIISELYKLLILEVSSLNGDDIFEDLLNWLD